MAVLAAAMLLVVWVTALPSAVLPTVVCNISDHGGVGDNFTVSTAAFRAAAAACAGQGTARARAVVLVPAGTWLTGAFNLSSHTELRLEAGATIAAVNTMDRLAFPAVAPFPSYGVCNDGQCHGGTGQPAWCHARTQAVISAFDADNVAIVGAGSMQDSAGSVVDGRGCWWWAQFVTGRLQFCRPQLVNFVGCTGVEVTGVLLKDPPFWNLHVWNSSDVHLHDLRIYADPRPSCGAPGGPRVIADNSDGIDVDSSSDVLIDRVHIQAQDDAVAIKSGKDRPGRTFGVPSARIVVRRSVLISNDFAVGSECSGGCSDITLRDSTMSDANGSAIDVLRLKSAAGRGGYLRNILVDNVTAPALRNGARPPDAFRCTLEGSGTPISNVTLRNIRVGVAAGLAGRFYGSGPGMPWLGLRLENVSVGQSDGAWDCRNVKNVEFVNVYPPDLKKSCVGR